jgi:predicted nucleic acid-binding protein
LTSSIDFFGALTSPPRFTTKWSSPALACQGATEVANAKWVEVRNLQNQADLLAAQQNYALGVGELSTILLGKELHANAVLLDDYKARKLATAEGLQVRGSVGLLETLLPARLLNRSSCYLSATPHG